LSPTGGVILFLKEVFLFHGGITWWEHLLYLHHVERERILFCSSFRWGKVDRSVTEHLSAQLRSDPRGGLCCFWCPNKTWTPPHGASDTLTIIKNGLEIRKLLSPKVKRVKNSKRKASEHYNDQFPNTKKIPCMLLCCY